jgi:hypothetical protein
MDNIGPVHTQNMTTAQADFEKWFVNSMKVLVKDGNAGNADLSSCS